MTTRTKEYSCLLPHSLSGCRGHLCVDDESKNRILFLWKSVYVRAILTVSVNFILSAMRHCKIFQAVWFIPFTTFFALIQLYCVRVSVCTSKAITTSANDTHSVMQAQLTVNFQANSLFLFFTSFYRCSHFVLHLWVYRKQKMSSIVHWSNTKMLDGRIETSLSGY